MRVNPQINTQWWGQLDRKPTKAAGGETFRDRFLEALDQVNQAEKTADLAAQKLATGEADDLSEVMISAEQARLSLLLTLRLRNQAIDAYREIMRMQV